MNWTTCCRPGTPTRVPPPWTPTNRARAGWDWKCAAMSAWTPTPKSWNSSRGCASTGAPPGSTRPAASCGWTGSGCTWMGRSQSDRLDGDLQHAVALVGKQIVGRNDVVQLVVVGDQHAQVQALGCNHIHQAAHAFLAAGAQGRIDAMVAQAGGEGIERNPQVLGIHPQAGQGPARLEAAQGLLERGLRAERLDGRIGAAP